MNEISKEKIEINGKEYSLFLNRKGLVAWEKFCKDELEKMSNIQEKFTTITETLSNEEKVEINDDTDPFEGIENIDEVDEDSKIVTQTFKRLYWIMLYTEHKFSVSEAEKLYDDACIEYGETQLIQLAQQMIEDMNSNKVEVVELKNLKALRQKKN